MARNFISHGSSGPRISNDSSLRRHNSHKVITGTIAAIAMTRQHASNQSSSSSRARLFAIAHSANSSNRIWPPPLASILSNSAS